MSLRATVSTADRRLAASFVFEGEGEPSVECAGTLGELDHAAAADLLTGGVAAACAIAARRCPGGLQVRATSSIPARDTTELYISAATAAAVAANALLGLGLDEAAIARATEEAVHRISPGNGGSDGVVIAPQLVETYRISVRESCPDD